MFTNNLAIELGENSRIGVQCQNVGYGLLVAEDIVTVHGSYVEEIIVEYAEKPIVINVSGSTSNTNNNTDNNVEEDDDMADWIIKNTDYIASNKDKIIISQNTPVQITLPSNPSPGNSVAFLKFSNTEYPVTIQLGNAKYKYQSISSLTLYIDSTEVKLIYVSTEISWIPSQNNVFSQN